MVTVAILSLAVVLIYETFFISLDLMNYSYDYLKTVSWVDNKMWQAQNELSRFNALAETETSGAVTFDNKNFNWKLSYASAGAPGLYRIDSTLSWREGRKDAGMSRTAYAMYVEEKK